MASVASLQAQISMMSMENLSGSKEDGRGKLAHASEKRQEMRDEVQQRKDRAMELMVEAAEAQDTEWYEDVWNFFTGGDNGAGEIADQMGTNQAELERVQNELKVLKAETDGVLENIKEANAQTENAYRASEEMLQSFNRNIKQAI